MKIKVINLSGYDLPKKSTKGSSGFDLKMKIGMPKMIIPKGEKMLIPTGIYLEMPLGYEAQIRSRSGLAAKNGVFVLNSPGTIDSDYRGEIQVILFNLGSSDFTVNEGDRIAQMVIQQIPIVELVEESEISESERGSGGFGSTGVSDQDYKNLKSVNK